MVVLNDEFIPVPPIGGVGVPANPVNAGVVVLNPGVSMLLGGFAVKSGEVPENPGLAVPVAVNSPVDGAAGVLVNKGLFILFDLAIKPSK